MFFLKRSISFLLLIFLSLLLLSKCFFNYGVKLATSVKQTTNVTVTL